MRLYCFSCCQVKTEEAEEQQQVSKIKLTIKFVEQHFADKRLNVHDDDETSKIDNNLCHVFVNVSTSTYYYHPMS